MDAGLSGKKTKDLLADVGVDINDIDMAFLSTIIRTIVAALVC